MSAKLWNFKIPYLIETRNDGGGGILPDVLGGGKFAKVYSGRKLIDSQPVHRVAIKVLHDRATCQDELLLGTAEVPVLQDMMQAPSDRIVHALDVIDMPALCMCLCGDVFQPLCKSCGALLTRQTEPVRGYPVIVCESCGRTQISAEDIYQKQGDLFERKPCNEARRCRHKKGSILNFVHRRAIVMELLGHRLDEFVNFSQDQLQRVCGVDTRLPPSAPSSTVVDRFTRALKAPAFDQIVRKVLLLEKVFAMVQITEAVSWLHGEKHIIHKDLAPDNIMFTTALDHDSAYTSNVIVQSSTPPELLLWLAQRASEPTFGIKVIDFGLSDRSEKPTLSWYDDDDTRRANTKLPFLSPEAMWRRLPLSERLQLRPDGRSIVLPVTLRNEVMPLDKFVDSRDIVHRHDLSVEEVFDDNGVRVARVSGEPSPDFHSARFEHIRMLRQPHDLFALGAIFYYLLSNSLQSVEERLHPLVKYVQGNEAIPLDLELKYAQNSRRMALDEEGTYVNARNALSDPFPIWQDRLLVVILRAMVRGRAHSYASDRATLQDAGHAARRLLHELWQIRLLLQTEVLSEIHGALRRGP
jgi:serine/threonine protein kinase